MQTPLHLWIIATIALIWNAGGAADYVLTRIEYAPYIANMPEGMLAYIQAYPIWMAAVWPIAVWLPVLGALLLFARSKAAAMIFGLDIPFIAAAGVYNYVLAEPTLDKVAGEGVFTFWAAILVIAMVLWLYARAMVKRGVLT